MSGQVGLDIRAPLGGLFGVLGLMLASYGLISGPGKVAWININLWWGVVMLVFGALLLFQSRRAMR